jgi:hypothetical protein
LRTLASARYRKKPAVVDDLEALTRNYRITFLRYLPRRDEAALTRAYDLGRQAIAAGVSLLDILNIHHIVLAEISRETPDEVADTVRAAAAFFAEVVAPYEMVQRALLDKKLDKTYRQSA